MNDPALERWRAEVGALRSTKIVLSRPISVFLDEAVEVAKFHAKHWAAQRDDAGGVVRAGLEFAAREDAPRSIGAHTGEEIRSLVMAARAADMAYRLARKRPPRAPIEEGRAVLATMLRFLRWYADEDQPELRGRLANFDARHARARNRPALASALEAYASLTSDSLEALRSFETFDPSCIDRAKQLAWELRERSGRVRLDDAAKQALDLRNGLFILLRERVQLVRRAAEFVFTKNDAVLGELVSKYDRRKRVAAKARARRRVDESSGAAPNADTMAS